jgi:hypothetical protein
MKEWQKKSSAAAGGTNLKRNTDIRKEKKVEITPQIYEVLNKTQIVIFKVLRTVSWTNSVFCDMT